MNSSLTECVQVSQVSAHPSPQAPIQLQLPLSVSLAWAGNLRPLLNGESLKNWPNGEFEKRMSQIWSIFKQMFENRSIFKQMFENTIHFQTHFEKNTPPQGAAAPWGRRRRRRQGYFFKICLKMNRIFKHLFENGPYLGHPISKSPLG